MVMQMAGGAEQCTHGSFFLKDQFRNTKLEEITGVKIIFLI